MELKKNIKVGKNKFNLLFLNTIFILFFSHSSYAIENLEGAFTDVKILDKISSKNNLISLKNSEELIFGDLAIKSMKCKNSEFDDNPEVTAYIQVRDLTNKDNNEVFVFNGWIFSSSPSINPFDHPVYDIWLVKCYWIIFSLSNQLTLKSELTNLGWFKSILCKGIVVVIPSITNSSNDLFIL